MVKAKGGGWGWVEVGKEDKRGIPAIMSVLKVFN